MTVVIAMLSLITLYWAASFYVRRARLYLDASESAWDRLYEEARTLVQDQAIPHKVAAFATAATVCAGCGCLTRQLLIDKARIKLGLLKPRRENGQLELSDEQAKAFNKLVVQAIYYDSLRAPISGFLLRRMVFPWLRAAAEGEAPVRRTSATMMAKSSAAAIRHRKEGRDLLAA